MSRAPAPFAEVSTLMERRRAAGRDPDRTLVAERGGDGWRKVSWAAARTAADATAQSLLDRGPNGRPVAVLAGNSVEHLLLPLGAHTAGVTVAPLSVAYSLQSSDQEQLRWLLEQVKPFLVLAGDPAAYGAAIELAGRTAEAVTPEAILAPVVGQNR